jgi:flagellin-like protein
MNVRALLTDESSVSPVIGVILMVAITTILAALIGALALGLAPSQDTPPSAQFQFEGDAAGLTVTHDGGESIPATGLVFRGTAIGAPAVANWSTLGTSETVETGSSVRLNDTPAGGGLGQGTLRVVWAPDETASGTTLGTHTVRPAT